MIRRFGKKIVDFVRIVFEIVKFAPVGLRVDREPPALAHQGSDARRIGKPRYATVRFFFNERHTVGGIRCSTFDQRQERAPLDAVTGQHPGTRQNRRGNVDGRGQGRAAAIQSLRIIPDEGHAHQALVMQRPLEQQAMIPHVIAVIAQKDDDRILGQIKFAQGLHDLPDGIVDHRNRAVIQGDGLTCLHRIDGDDPRSRRFSQSLCQLFMDGTLVRRRGVQRCGKRFGQLHFIRCISRPVRFRRREGMVGVRK